MAEMSVALSAMINIFEAKTFRYSILTPNELQENIYRQLSLHNNKENSLI